MSDHRYSRQSYGGDRYGGKDNQSRGGYSNYDSAAQSDRRGSYESSAQQRYNDYYKDDRQRSYGEQAPANRGGSYDRAESRYSQVNYSDQERDDYDHKYAPNKYAEQREPARDSRYPNPRYTDQDGSARDTYGRDKYAAKDGGYDSSSSTSSYGDSDYGRNTYAPRYPNDRPAAGTQRYSHGGRDNYGRDAYNRHDNSRNSQPNYYSHDRRDDYRSEGGYNRSDYNRYDSGSSYRGYQGARQSSDDNEKNERLDVKNWRKNTKEPDHIVYESELVGDDPEGDDYTSLPSGPTAAEKQKESGFGRYRGRGRGRGGRGAYQGGRGPVARGPDGERKEILKPYRKSVSVPDVCFPFVIGKDRHHLNALEEKLKFDAEFEVSKLDENEKGKPYVIEIFAISEEVLRRVENMLHLRITEGLTSRQPGHYFTVVDITTPMAQFTRYIGEEYNKSDKSFVLDGTQDEIDKPDDPTALNRPRDTRPWKPPPSNKRLPYDLGVVGVGTTAYVALKKHPQQCFKLIQEQMANNVRSSFKVFARLGKMIFDSKSTDFPRSGQYVRPDDVSKVLTKDLARVRFITTIPYTPIARLHDVYLMQNGYKLESISRKIAVHYFNGVDRLIATFHVPSPTVSAFSSATVNPKLQYATPILAKVKIENHRLLMTNYSRDANHIDYRLSAISAIAQSSEDHDDIIHIIASAWAMKKPSEINEEMTLELPLAYRNLNMHIVRYKTSEQYVSKQDGATIKLTKLLQDEVSNGQWLSVANFKKLQVQQTTAKEMECPLCNAMFRDPCTVPCCGESYCRECMQDKKTCPACQQGISPDRLVPNKKLDKLVEELRKLSGTLGATDEYIPASASLVAPPIAKSKWEVSILLHKWQDALADRSFDDQDCLRDVPMFMEKVQAIADACGNPFK